VLSTPTIARALELGRWDGIVTRALASAWAPVAARGLVRPAIVPAPIAVVCVGGATLGGSGKTRLAIACARALAEDGARVVLVGHAYRSARRNACVVSIGTRGDVHESTLEEVGDEALVCARSLLASGVRVVVGPTRQSAIDHATTLSPDVIVLDGPLRISRSGRILSLLAVDADQPWGSRHLPPAGDLRATREALVACADHVVPVDATPTAVRWESGLRAPVTSLAGMRLGLFTAIARPGRLIDKLQELGARLEEIVSVSDHGPMTAGARATLLSSGCRRVDVDAWIATEKCALHLGEALRHPRFGTLESCLSLSSSVRRALKDVMRA
jgi:tetraacyldisaccharide 4'-kinase